MVVSNFVLTCLSAGIKNRLERDGRAQLIKKYRLTTHSQITHTCTQSSKTSGLKGQVKEFQHHISTIVTRERHGFFRVVEEGHFSPPPPCPENAFDPLSFSQFSLEFFLNYLRN